MTHEERIAMAANCRFLPGSPLRCKRCEGSGWNPSDDGWGARDKCKVCNGKGVLPVWSQCHWFTPQVVSMAQRNYDERDYSADALDVLADALEDADCPADSDLVRHLRGLEPCPACFGTGAECDPRDVGKPYDVTLWQCTRCEGRKWTPLRVTHVRGCWVIDLILGKE